MEVAELIAVLGRRWLVILATAGAAAVVGYLNFASAPPTYRAEANVRVFTTMVGDASWTDFNLQYSDRLINTYVAVLSGEAVRDALVVGLQSAFPGLDEDSLPKLEVAVVPTTEILNIAAEAQNPDLAAAVVNGAADLLVARELPAFAASAVELPPGTAAQPRTAISILERAAPPIEPSGPGLPVVMVIVTVAGLCVGAGLALLLNAFDTRLHDLSAVTEATGLPLLGSIPRFGRWPRDRSLDRLSTQAREAFRGLRLHVERSALLGSTEPYEADDGRGVGLLVTSSKSGDGASTIAVHLALTAAESGIRVLLVDMNLRTPAIGRMFSLHGLYGISDVLAGKAHIDDVIRRSAHPNLSLLPSGARSTTGHLMLHGPAFEHSMQRLRDAYDLVVIDSPPFPRVMDAALIAPHVQGVLLVVRCGSSPRSTVSEAVARWRLLSAPLVGAVANCAPRRSRDAAAWRAHNLALVDPFTLPHPFRDGDVLGPPARSLTLQGTTEK
ncbi:MAG TPA: AAA family ATPase [Trueperaceae bacterium]|nr:AAA family ATPase [Trueperaceae bacterium]